MTLNHASLPPARRRADGDDDGFDFGRGDRLPSAARGIVSGFIASVIIAFVAFFFYTLYTEVTP